MYAVVQTGGKQYRVSPGDYVTVERLEGNNGDHIELKDILLIDNEGKVIVGAPFVKDASVVATIVNQNRADKIIVFKKKRRQNYRRKNGHRQLQSVLHISEIKGDGKSAKAENKPKVAAAEKATAPKAEKAAPAKKAAAPKAEKPVEAKAEKAPAKEAAPKTEKAPAKKEAAPAAKKPAAEKKAPAAKKPAAPKKK